ncbi:MAG: DUF1704 domain-containing protein, partial [Bdellovibrionales bacterium]|nr:DUF1704 domain-containing protein [Bdellovibrionales bacterium]
MRDIKKITEINEQAFKLSSGIKLLGHISWPTQIEKEFLESFKKGRLKLPQIEYQKINYDEQHKALKTLKESFTPEDPIETFTAKTIQSYLDMIELVRAIGTNGFTEISKKIFGAPGDLLPGSQVNSIEASQHLVALSDDFSPPYVKSPNIQVSANAIKNYLERR